MSKTISHTNEMTIKRGMVVWSLAYKLQTRRRGRGQELSIITASFPSLCWTRLNSVCTHTTTLNIGTLLHQQL